MREIIGKIDSENGFADYMAKRAVGVPGTEHHSIPMLGRGALLEETNIECIDLRIEGEAADHVEKVAAKQGLKNGGELINEALHFYLCMLEAENKGFTNLVLVNPETEEVIQLDIS